MMEEARDRVSKTKVLGKSDRLDRLDNKLKCTYSCCNLYLAQPGTNDGLPSLSGICPCDCSPASIWLNVSTPQHIKHEGKRDSYPSPPLALPPCQAIQTLPRSQNPRSVYISKSLTLTQNSVAQRHVRSWSANSC